MATTKFIEDSYEQAIIALFKDELGYDYTYGYDIERDFREPYLREEVRASVKRLNPLLPDATIDDVVKKVCDISEGTLLQNNEAFMEMMQNGVETQTLSIPLKEGSEERTVIAKLMDYEHPELNSFKIVNQWRVHEHQNIRCDLVVLVNGLPVVVMELKSASAEDATITNAYNQIENYKLHAPSLFTYNAFNVISDMAFTKAGTLTAKEDRYMDWKTVDGKTESALVADYQTFFRGIFKKERLLNILRNYICFDKKEGNVRKIMTAYHQYYAVEKAVERTHLAVDDRTGKIGVFWHTQGSGKSLSMVFFAHQLIQQFSECTIVVVTDRKDLDEQLYGQFARCQSFLRQTPVEATSRSTENDDTSLYKLLKDRKAGGIIFTTIQKFSPSPDLPQRGEENTSGCLCDRRNIIVMSDEAHRSQYGDEYWDAKSQTMRKSFSKLMHEALPNASFIGFTGTPISDRDRDTQEVFGDYIDIYDMTQAVNDGATRPVYYESRVVNLNLDQDVLEALNREFDTLADEGATDEQILAAKRESSHLEALLGNDKTIDALVRDIIKHYEENRAQELTGKAMIVALTRQIGVKIYNKMLELRPEWKEKVKLVMSTSNKDPKEITELLGTEKDRKALALRFKDDNDPLKIVIVRDMWLTGFDVPSLSTMYVFKPMKGHNLMQAIARVNRVFPEKEGGLVVDYVGIAQALKNAMQQYTKRDQKRFGDPDIAKTAMKKWQEEMEICQDLMHGFDYSDFFEVDNDKKARAITKGANWLVSPTKEVQKKSFIEHSRDLHNATTLCRSMLSVNQRLEVAYFDVVRSVLVKLSGSGKLTKRDINDRISTLLQQSVKSEGVINLFKDNKEDFSLFNETFIKEIQQMKEKNLAVELLKKLMKERVKKHARTNVIQSQKFSDMMNMSLSNYLKGLLTNEEVIKELLEIAHKMKEDEEKGNDLGLSNEEKAFYDALSTPEGVRQAYSDEQFVELTKELTDTLHKNRTIDWNHKESARAKMRVLIKRLLKKYKYPPEGAEAALETVMRQCDNWADNEDNFVAEESYVKIHSHKPYAISESLGYSMVAEDIHE